MAVQVGQLIGERYRLEQRLSSAPPAEAPQGELWRASDQLAADEPGHLGMEQPLQLAPGAPARGGHPGPWRPPV